MIRDNHKGAALGSPPKILWIDERGKIFNSDTHSVHIWNLILSKIGDVVTKEDYNNGTSVLHSMSDSAFIDRGLTKEEVDILRNRIDPRDHMIDMGWVRCRVEDGYAIVQMKRAENFLKLRALDANIYDIETESGFFAGVPREELGGNLWLYKSR